MTQQTNKKWQVFKAWEFLPNTKQPATQTQHPTKEEAEEEAETLRPLFPGRIFTIESVK